MSAPAQAAKPDPILSYAALAGAAWDEGVKANAENLAWANQHGGFNQPRLALAYHAAIERALAYEKLIDATPSTTVEGAVLRLVRLMETIFANLPTGEAGETKEGQEAHMAADAICRELSLLADRLGIDFKAAGLEATAQNVGVGRCYWPDV